MSRIVIYIALCMFFLQWGLCVLKKKINAYVTFFYMYNERRRKCDVHYSNAGILNIARQRATWLSATMAKLN